MKELLIVGSRGFGREVFNLAKQCAGYQNDFIVKGFLDDKADALDGFKDYPPILSSLEDYQVERNDVFVIALGDVQIHRKYAEKVADKNGQFFSLIHPSVIISLNTLIGKGALIFPYVSISCDCILGDHVTVHPFCGFGHDIKVGNFCSVGAYSYMSGYSQIENLVTLFTKALILPQIKVETGSIVGAGSVVMSNVPKGVTVHGNPAKIIYHKN